MHFNAKTLDDLLNDVFTELIKRPFDVTTSRSEKGGDTSEIIGTLLQLEIPTSRLSRTETKGKLFSALGELMWYLSKDKKLDFIKHYIIHYETESFDGETIYGGYGPRLFNMHEKYNQVNNIIELLKQKPNSRRAVIQLFDAVDISQDFKEIPCTCTLQFMIRNKKLHMHVSMRSNDAYWGLPHDVFVFTMMQEIIARTLNVDLGIYSHSVGSLHLYAEKKEFAQQYLSEGFQSTKITMPKMPQGNPWPILEELVVLEAEIRTNPEFKLPPLKFDPYWADIIRLLYIYSLHKHGNNS
ncbi:MAG: thyA, partial [Bacteroidota bacterium]|nr:thyA [Bacteroidota bacterium]